MLPFQIIFLNDSTSGCLRYCSCFETDYNNLDSKNYSDHGLSPVAFLFLFFFLQASGLNIPDAGFMPDFRKENNSSSSSSIRVEYFKRRLRADFYNRVQASGF